MPPRNIYDKIGTGVLKVILLGSIGALCLGRFGGFEFLRLDSNWIQQQALQVKSVRMIFQSVEALVLGNVSLYGGIAICIYAAMGILRCPGQSLFHMLLSFMIGPAVGVPVSLLAYTISSLSLYYVSYGYEVRDFGDGSVLMYFSSRIDVFVMKIAQCKYNIFVDHNGQKYDKATLLETGTEAYQKKKKAEKEIDEDWSEWAGWNTSRFMYLLYWRVFPLTSHSYMNLVGGLLGMRGIVPALEYTVATFIGSIPWVYVCCKFGDALHTYHLEDMLRFDAFRYPLIAFILAIPAIVNKTGLVDKLAIKTEFGSNGYIVTSQGNEPLSYETAPIGDRSSESKKSK